MSGKKKGGLPYLKLTKKDVDHEPDPNHPGHTRVRSERDVLADTPLPKTATDIQLGLRIKIVQQIDEFTIMTQTKNPVDIPKDRQPANDPIAQDLTATLGCPNDEQWVTYLVHFDPDAHGKEFDTTLVLSNYDIPDNGFQVLPVALAHHNQTFQNGIYGFGVSLIPGKNNTGWAMNMGAISAKTAEKKTTKVKAKKKTKKKTAASGKKASKARKKR